ncbi:MAG: RNA 2',3'-cyclic phosphodiesterase [Candidatus Parvarchaeota archaeon]|nr:RNA 2',3'-cyclic phosphodiesterase [Candidatus Parvarchaeota archaeon]
MNRYFVAVEIPEETKKEIASFFYPILAQKVTGKFVSVEKLHITVLFLGNVEIKPELLDFLKGLKFMEELKVKGLGAFPSILDPKTIYAKVYGSLKNQFEGLSSFLKIESNKEFSPHVTLCRAKKIIGRIDEKEFEAREFKFAADSLHLFNSDFANYYKVL